MFYSIDRRFPFYQRFNSTNHAFVFHPVNIPPRQASPQPRRQQAQALHLRAELVQLLDQCLAPGAGVIAKALERVQRKASGSDSLLQNPMWLS